MNEKLLTMTLKNKTNNFIVELPDPPSNDLLTKKSNRYNLTGRSVEDQILTRISKSTSEILSILKCLG